MNGPRNGSGGHRLTTRSAGDTRRLGYRMGRWAAPATVLAIYGDLGSGKTELARGMARGLGVPENVYVTSPTYTFINEYRGRCRFYHVDLYRLDGVGDGEEIGLPEILHGPGVTAIEWPERLEPHLLGDHLKARLRIAGDDAREIVLRAHGPASESLLQNLQAHAGADPPPPAGE